MDFKLELDLSVYSSNCFNRFFLLSEVENRASKIKEKYFQNFLCVFCVFQYYLSFFYLSLSFPREFQSSSSRQNSVFPDKSITVPCLRMLAQTMEPYLFSKSQNAPNLLWSRLHNLPKVKNCTWFLLQSMPVQLSNLNSAQYDLPVL